MKRPIIGIVSKHIKSTKVRTIATIGDELKQAIYDNGGIAIGILSPDKEILFTTDNWQEVEDRITKEAIIEEIELCDGIILQGGLTNEAYESWIAKYCYENNIPCLGICAGQNNIARGTGGTTTYVSNPEKHDKSFDEYVHKVYINEDSKFYEMVKKKEIMVNSIHKRTIDKCPKLQKVGFCEDGYPDVIEDRNKRFYIGVRFHPESLYKNDKNMANIFKNFIQSCNEKSKNKL